MKKLQLIVALAGLFALVILPGCPKQDTGDDTAGGDTTEKKADKECKTCEDGTEKAPEKKEDGSEAAPEKKEDAKETAPEKKAESGDGALSKKPADGLMPLKLELPKPQFEGTPKRIQGINNLEPPKGKGWKRPTFYVPEGTVNLAKGKEVAASDDLPIIGEPNMITDGDKEGMDQSVVEFAPGKQWVQIDLGKKCEIYAIMIWHYHKQARAYKDVIVQVADDADMITNKKTIFNDDDDNSSKMGIGEDFSYVEVHEGKLIDGGGVKGQFVRFYSNGNSTNDMNHYIEIEIYGKPCK